MNTDHKCLNTHLYLYKMNKSGKVLFWHEKLLFNVAIGEYLSKSISLVTYVIISFVQLNIVICSKIGKDS